MDRAVALVRLGKMTAATSRPALSEDELGALLDSYRTPDSEGRLVTDSGWVPTYNLNAAAAEGWRWKAAAVVGDFNFSADNASFNKGEVQAKCLEMEKRFAALDHGNSVTAEPSRYAGPYDSPRLTL